MSTWKMVPIGSVDPAFHVAGSDKRHHFKTYNMHIMPSLKKQVRFTLVMAFISMATLLLSHLALTDIYNGEADTSLEWRVLQVAAVIFGVFVLSTVSTLIRVLRTNN